MPSPIFESNGNRNREELKMAGRPRTTTKNTAQTETINTETHSDDNTKIELLEKENELLKSQVNEILALLKDMKSKETEIMSNVNSKNNDSDIYEENNHEFVDINPLKPIKVISLSDGGVNLKTTNDGNAKVFRFDKFGHVATITYADLQDCIATCRPFIEDGTVYICDKDVVRNNYLDEYYKHFLTVDTMNNILSFPQNKIVDMVKNTTPTIQDTLIDLMVKKINNNENVDMNKIDAIGKACAVPCDITALALQKRNG